MHHVILVDSEPGSSALAGRYRGVATVDHRVERGGSTATQPRLHVQLDYIPPELYETANYA